MGASRDVSEPFGSVRRGEDDLHGLLRPVPHREVPVPARCGAAELRPAVDRAGVSATLRRSARATPRGPPDTTTAVRSAAAGCSSSLRCVSKELADPALRSAALIDGPAAQERTGRSAHRGVRRACARRQRSEPAQGRAAGPRGAGGGPEEGAALLPPRADRAAGYQARSWSRGCHRLRARSGRHLLPGWRKPPLRRPWASRQL